MDKGIDQRLGARPLLNVVEREIPAAMDKHLRRNQIDPNLGEYYHFEVDLSDNKNHLVLREVVAEPA